MSVGYPTTYSPKLIFFGYYPDLVAACLYSTKLSDGLSTIPTNPPMSTYGQKQKSRRDNNSSVGSQKYLGRPTIHLPHAPLSSITMAGKPQYQLSRSWRNPCHFCTILRSWLRKTLFPITISSQESVVVPNSGIPNP